MTTSTSISNEQKLASYWLKLAVCMLALSGIFSLIIVFARTPGLYDIPYIQKLFHEALVIHVDLLVLCWPLCIAAMMWGLFCPSKLSQKSNWRFHARALGIVTVGALCLALAPLDLGAEPLKNNYVPVITSKVFLAGLLIIAIAAAALAFNAVFLNQRNNMNDVSLKATCNWGARGAGIITLFAIIAIYLGFANTSREFIDAEHYYESAFWAGGHIFQYTFTQLQMVAWLWIFYQLTQRELPSYQWVRAIFLLNAVIGSAGIYGILTFDTLSFEYNQFYTQHMIIGGGIAPMLFLIYMFISSIKNRLKASNNHTYLRAALCMSVALFLYGGILGLLIQGQDVTIPAHYHGATISVTIALMGFAYAYLPNISNRDIPKKLIKWQPIIYGGGQFMHITGLAISGGYGALRKTPGVEGTANAKIAMGVMGGGGLLAVIGGLMFVYIMWVCLRQKAKN